MSRTAAWDAERAESEKQRVELSGAFDAQGAKLEVLKTKVSELEDHGSAKEIMSALLTPRPCSASRVAFERLTVDTRAWITPPLDARPPLLPGHTSRKTSGLWTAWVVTQVNGRIGTALGRARHIAQPPIEAALLTLAGYCATTAAPRFTN